jgi:hypothetical protein
MAIKECKNCKLFEKGICSKLKYKVSINATWCKDYDINVQVGTLITRSLSEKTMLFKVTEGVNIKHLKYAIVPLCEYEKLITNQ